MLIRVPMSAVHLEGVNIGVTSLCEGSPLPTLIRIIQQVMHIADTAKQIGSQACFLLKKQLSSFYHIYQITHKVRISMSGTSASKQADNKF